MRKIRSKSALLVALLAFAVPVAGQAFPSDDEIQEILDGRVAAGGAVGIAVGLLEADGSTRFLSSGSAGEGAAPPASGTLFEIGSITKVFTGTLLAEMAGRGEVALDDPIQGYLPDGVTAPTRGGREITLTDLATHRSALPRLPLNMAPADMSDPYVDYTEEQLYAFLSSYELPRDIGAEGEYSNLGAGLLGHLLSRHLGLSYEDAVRERILAPLGMSMTGIELTPRMAEAMALGHDPGGDVVPLWNVAVLSGAGGLRSNVDDMLRFMAANVGEPQSDLERALREAHRPRTDLGPMQIGLNWITRNTDGQRTVWHNGGTAGFRTFAGFDPDAGTAVVVLTNSGIGADDIGFHLLNPSSELVTPPVPAYLHREAVELEPAVLERYVGAYELAPQMIATFEIADGRLRTRLTNQPSVYAYAASETVFFLRAVAAEIEFEIDEAGEVQAMILRQGGQTLRGARVR
ncbi:MAG: hypothetical protein AMS19_07485 [Gemmatimonas sp. SG8_23]|nr:MAG: hypothetical protein AMS19_07485 [Gemmatimonas sp. SG8_23]